MYYMSAFRQILLSMLVFVLVPPAMVRGSTDTATYVGGSVKSIPLNLIGTLDVSERGELRFDYGTGTYKLPCNQITSTAVTQDETRHILPKVPVLHKIPVPSLLPGRKKETLTVNYKNAAGASGTLNFELTASQASALLEIIAIKKATPETSASSQSDGDWWGDKYWKTNRNRTGWEGGANPASQTASTATGVVK
jgi:hypothetical protein